MIQKIAFTELLSVLANIAGWVMIIRAVLVLVRQLAGAPDPDRANFERRILMLGGGGAALLFLAFLLPSGGAPTPGFQVPLAWVAMPYTAWFTLVGLVGVTVRLGRMLLLGENSMEHSSSAGLWAFFAGVSYMLFRGHPTLKGWEKSDHVIEIFRGVATFDASRVAMLCGLLLVTFFVMARMERSFRARRLTKTIGTHFALIAGSVLFGIPFAWLLTTSFKEDKDIVSQQGLSFVPKVAVQEAYKDPDQPEFETQYQNRTVRVHILRERAGELQVELLKPLAMRGMTFTLPDRSSLKEVPRMVPVVTGTFQGKAFSGIVIKEEDDGHRVVLARTPSELAGKEIRQLGAELKEERAVGLKWANYPEALDLLPPETEGGMVFLRNTVFLVIANVIGTLLSCTMVAYAFARLRFPGRGFLFSVLMATMMLPGAVTMLPVFLIWKAMGGVDTLYPLWAGSFFAGAFNVFLLQQFFRTVPIELEDAAKIDGCGYWSALWRVMVPQVKPALAAVGIFTAMGTWNNFQGSLIYINSPELMPISYAVQLFQGAHSADYALLMAFSTMAVVPVVILFFVGQKYFVEGVTLSGFGGR